MTLDFQRGDNFLGLRFMGALWKVRAELEAFHGIPLGGDIADALFLGWMNAFDQDRVHSIIMYQWLLLDDDDHNLSNGTPNIVLIENGFQGNAFPPFRYPLTFGEVLPANVVSICH